MVLPEPYELNNLIGNNPNHGNYLRQAEKIKTKLVSWLNSINSPYSWIWNTIDQLNGSYTIKVKAWDIIDQPGEDTIKVNVDNPTKKIKYEYKR